MGRPSIIVSFVLVTLSEPLGIGLAVTPTKVLAAADATEASVVLPEGLLVAFADEVTAAPLEVAGELETEAAERVLVDRTVSEVLVSRGGVDAAAAVDEAS